jgi:hypothetical protein
MPVQAFRSPPSVAGASKPMPPLRWRLRLVSDAECVALQIVQRYEIVPQSFRGRSLLDAIAGSRQPGLSRIASCGHRFFAQAGILFKSSQSLQFLGQDQIPPRSGAERNLIAGYEIRKFVARSGINCRLRLKAF